MKNSLQLLLLTAIIFLIAGLILGVEFSGKGKAGKITVNDVAHAEKLISMHFTRAEADSMLAALDAQAANYAGLRKITLQNSVLPAFQFIWAPEGILKTDSPGLKISDYSRIKMPENRQDLAFLSVGELSALIHSRQISSAELTGFFLERLKKYSPALHCVVTFTEKSAMEDAARADWEIASGIDRGFLHGIPYGIKDMFSTRNYPTTFGTPPFRDQMIDEDATVVKKLREAGAVMIAKLSLGELAMDDIWFGGKTRNPWDTARGSSGSSAGPASAVSAGLVPFAIGSETWGSIVSPSTVCGVTGLRPTYGRVSRYGAMALSWTMDKIGPICRNTEDCAIVLNYICGPDGKDLTVSDAPFGYSPPADLNGVTIGYFANEFEKDSSLNKPFNDAALEKLRQLGAKLIPLDLPPYPYNDMSVILMAEAAAAFDELTFSGTDDQMVQQNRDRWPNLFRAARFIPAADYIRASRLRKLLIEDWQKMMEKVDVVVAPSLAGDNLLATNLTGNPAVVMPNGFSDPVTPVSIVFIGQLNREGSLLRIAGKYQESTEFHRKHPPLVLSGR